MQRTALLSLVLLALGWIGGCARSSDGDNPKTYPVSGTVTQNGGPVAGATVNFQLADGSRSAFGITDESGKYTLTTFASGDGAVPGEYQIAITKFEGGSAPAGQPGGAEIPENYDAPPIEGGAAPAAGHKNLLPPQYAKAATSGLKATVTESESNQADFDLK